MRVLVLDTLLKQADKSNRRMPADVLPRIYKEYRTLAKLEKEGHNAILEYLTQNNNGKHMQGANGITIFKYDLTDGDRILYTYGKELPFLKKEKDSLVLLSYSNHDKQGVVAKSKDFQNTSHKYAYLSNVVRNLNSVSSESENITEDELYEIASFLLTESFCGYAYTDEELRQFSPEEIEKHLLLSEEQKDIITEFQIEHTPTLIMGGAGTGKTLIAVHLLNSIFNTTEDISIAYFTQSKILRNKVEDLYKQLQSESPVSGTPLVDFLDINSFCLDIVDIKEKQLISTKYFVEVFMQKVLPHTQNGRTLIEKLKQNGITYDNVWTEIRGTLKGGMKNWTRVHPMNQVEVTFNVSEYEKLGYIERLIENKKLFQLKNTIPETVAALSSDSELDTEDKNIIRKIISHFSTFNPDLKSISEDTYLSLSNEHSLLSKEQRKIILDIYNEYQQHLESNNIVDENDLVRAVIKAGAHKNNKYDFIFVDEVQDYTELQIYLLHELIFDKNNLVFAGDVHQIINPTLFSVSKLKELLNNDSNRKLRSRFLSTNFRCQKGVIDVANKLSDLRRHYIGSQFMEVEQYEKSNVDICLYDPYRLSYNEENIKNLLLEIIKYPQVAILVPDTKTKFFLTEYIKEFERPEFIFTVDEIKGMEYDYVVCYNLIDHFYDAWDALTSTDISDSRTKYRFYFNLLYVAITRAKRHLCFIDQNTLPIVEDALKLKREDTFDADLLHFTELDASVHSWLAQAHEYKKQGKYKNALQFYKIAEEEASILDIYDCHIGIAEENRDYEAALKYTLLKKASAAPESPASLDSPNDIIHYSNQLEENSPLKNLANFITNKKSSSNIADIIEMEFSNFEESEKAAISNYFITCLESAVLDHLDKKRIPEI